MDKNTKILVGIIAAIVVIWGIYSISQRSSQPGTLSTEGTKGAGDMATEPSTLGPIRIGSIGPLTGDAAVYGEPVKNTIELAVSQINSSGGINGQPLEVVYEDGKCSGKDAATAMQKLVSTDNVEVVLGGFCSSESLAAAPIANENQVVLFSMGSSSPDLTTEGGPFFFRDYPSDASQGKVLADIAYNSKGWKNVAVIYEQTDYAIGIYKAFSDNFTSLGGSVTAEGFATEVTDFRTVVTKLQNGNPDALLVSVQTPQQAELVLKQVGELGWKVGLMGADVIPGSDIPKNNPSLVEGMIVAEFGFDRESQKFQDLERAYMEMYGTDELPFASYMQTVYDGVYIIRNALVASGNDGEKIRQYLDNFEEWEGVSGMVDFDENGDRTAGHKAEVILNGKVVPFEG